jgi:hypothetical protein
VFFEGLGLASLGGTGDGVISRAGVCRASLPAVDVEPVTGGSALILM